MSVKCGLGSGSGSVSGSGSGSGSGSWSGSVAVLGGGRGHGPGPRAFHAQKGPRTFTPPMHLSECPKVFGKMSQSCPRCPQNGFN